MIQLLGKKKRRQQRRNELKALRDAIRESVGRNFLVVLSNINLVDQNGKDIGEIDGFFISKHYSRFIIYIVEAKDQKKGGNAAIRTQLRKLITEGLKVEENLTPRYQPLQSVKGIPKYQVVRIEA